MGVIYNERGASLLVAMILLFFVSQFILVIKMSYDHLYTNYSALEIYYEQQALEYLNKREIEEVQESVEEDLTALQKEVSLFRHVKGEMNVG